MTCHHCQNAREMDAQEMDPQPCAFCGEARAAGQLPPGHYLVSESGTERGQVVRIEQTGLRIGREPGVGGLVINDPEISRLHAVIEPGTDDEMVLEDRSVNGTFVGGTGIQRQSLRQDDQIRFGLRAIHTYRYREVASVAAVAAAKSGGVSPTEILSGHAFMPPEAAVAADLPFLELVLDRYLAKTIPLTGHAMMLGSRQGVSDVVVEHESIAPQHCQIHVDGKGQWCVRDFKTQSGTFVNGRRVKESPLRDRDVLQLGACESRILVFRLPGGRAVELQRMVLERASTRIGRDASNELRLDHPTVSRFHARIERQGPQYRIVDLASTNGTFVDGVRVNAELLRPGARILLGGLPLRFDGTALEMVSDGASLRLSCQGIYKSVIDSSTDLPLTLLNQITLELEPGELVGLLGPSGSGKSTLLDALNGTRPADAGTVLINHWNLYRNYAGLKHLVGYVPQDDILHRGLTVGRSLYYSARLRLPSDLSEAEIEARVEDVLGLLDLGERRDVMIAQLSGGQRKRVSLGIELLSKPSILFLDEPTAGQDPRTEMKMMQLFREIANSGATVILTTHLMGSLGLLDRAAVLVRGELAYYGPAAAMLPYFGGTQPHQMYERLQEKTPQQWAETYRQSGLQKEPDGPQPEAEAGAPPPSSASTSAPRRLREGWNQFLTLSLRQWELRVGKASSVLSALAAPIGIGLLTGAVKDGPNEPKVLFIMIFAALWFGGSAAVREIVDEAEIYRRERQRNLSLGAYLASKLLYGAALGTTQSLVFVLILAVCGALNAHLLVSWLLLSVVTFQGTLIGLLISALVSKSEQALAIFPLALIPQLLLAGLFVPVHAIHPFYPRWNATQAHMEIVDLPASLASPPMAPWLRDSLAAVMAGRWGLESLADVYVHDNQPYSLQILNTLHITLHPGDPARARSMLLAGHFNGPGPAPVKSSLPGYLGIFAALSAGMMLATAAALKRKDRTT